jgi:hypothetical protein
VLKTVGIGAVLIKDNILKFPFMFRRLVCGVPVWYVIDICRLSFDSKTNSIHIIPTQWINLNEIINETVTSCEVNELKTSVKQSFQET